MKKLLVIFMTLLVIDDAKAGACRMDYCDSTEGKYSANYVSCLEPEVMGCLRDEFVSTCSSCQAGWELLYVEARSPTSSCNYSYYTCKQICNGCSNCTSDASWIAHAPGYEKKTDRSCDCNTCGSTTSYRCAANYYGSSTNGAGGCTPCPSGGASGAGGTSITSCYISSGADASGGFIYTSNCYYAN